MNQSSARLLFAMIALTLGTTVSAFAEDAKCSAFSDFMKNGYYITTFDCGNLAGVNTFKLANPGKRKMTIGKLEYAVEGLDHLNGNPQVCGRDREVQQYKDKFGMIHSTDIGTDVFIKQNVVRPEILLPLTPAALNGNETLDALGGAYIDVAMRLTVGDKENKKQVQDLEKTRSDFWDKGLASIMTGESCANAFCVQTGGVDKLGAATKECLDQMAKIKADDLYKKLSLALPKAAAPQVVNTNTAPAPVVQTVTNGTATQTGPTVNTQTSKDVKKGN